MQRAVVCSYDSSTQTLYREAVLRMETPIRRNMSRVSLVFTGLFQKCNSGLEPGCKKLDRACFEAGLRPGASTDSWRRRGGVYG